MSSIKRQLHSVYERIHMVEKRSGRTEGSVKLIAVSKTFPACDVEECYQAGQYIFGENKVQEALGKIPLLPTNAEWHLIGPLQRNKVRKALGRFELIHSIDSLRLAQYMNTVAGELGITQPVLLEINVGLEDSKFGFTDSALMSCLPELSQLDRLQIKGLMCIPPAHQDPQASRPYFIHLRELRNRLAEQGFASLTELSMGMSHDFEVAIEEGATMVRVGSAIFGNRSYPV